MTATEYVVLVDANNHEIGTAEKISAHQQNLLHRAFSVFIFREAQGLELLLQKRAAHKYHCAQLWTNTCCSHPRRGEDIIAAGERRLAEEMGLSGVKLQDKGWFHYNAHFENGLSENEIDHVLVATVAQDHAFSPNPDEVAETRWVSLPALKAEMTANPERFTPWLAPALAVINPQTW